MKFLTLTAVVSLVLGLGSLSAQALPVANSEGAVSPQGNNAIGQAADQRSGGQVSGQQTADKLAKRTLDQGTPATANLQGGNEGNVQKGPRQQVTGNKKEDGTNAKRSVGENTAATTNPQEVNKGNGQQAPGENGNKEANGYNKRASDEQGKKPAKQTDN